MALIDELRRRKVFKVGGAYLVVAWFGVQAVSIAFPAFEAPHPAWQRPRTLYDKADVLMMASGRNLVGRMELKKCFSGIAGSRRYFASVRTLGDAEEQADHQVAP